MVWGSIEILGLIGGLHEQCRTTLSRRFKIEWLLRTLALWHYRLDPSRCIKLSASFAINTVAKMNVTDDPLSCTVTRLRERD